MISIAASSLLAVATPAMGDFELFNAGSPPVFKEEPDDRRFEKTVFFRSLSEGPSNDACARVLAGYFVALANAAPFLHKRDADFYVDHHLLQVLSATGGSATFPAPTYFSFMVRQVLIERKMPEPWFNTAKAVAGRTGAPIDLGRLAFIAEGVHRIDSFYFSLQALIDRYKKEVALSTSAAQPSALQEFRDKYIDREVAWGGLTLIDVQRVDPSAPPPAKPTSKGKHKKDEPPPAPPPARDDESSVPYYVAHLALFFPSTPMDQMMGRKPVDPLRVTARLRERQYLDVAHEVVSRKFLVRGKLWELGEVLQGIELSDAVLFEEGDWSQWTGTSTPADVAACPMCVNELFSVAKPPAFRHEKTY